MAEHHEKMQQHGTTDNHVEVAPEIVAFEAVDTHVAQDAYLATENEHSMTVSPVELLVVAHFHWRPVGLARLHNPYCSLRTRVSLVAGPKRSHRAG